MKRFLPYLQYLQFRYALPSQELITQRRPYFARIQSPDLLVAGLHLSAMSPLQKIFQV